MRGVRPGAHAFRDPPLIGTIMASRSAILIRTDLVPATL